MPDKPLREYEQKRDFQETPEPRGEEEQGENEALRFVVQKHGARRLHYDLRLEMEGVLKSWAVPKGPSLDPSDKRLAVHTENHPLKYLTFEGVIPKGQYGAGNMIVWDRGTFECLGAEKDPVKAFAKGTIDIRLHGEKLKGMWLLVKLKGEPNQWLFFKKPDQYSDSTRDLLEEMPESVLSGRRVEELIEGASSTWSSRLERLLDELQLEPGRIDEKVRPMLATLDGKVPQGPRWFYELKYDGIRALAWKRESIYRLYSRNLKPLEAQFPEILAELEEIPARDFLLDGEIVAMDDRGRSSFQLLQGRINRRNSAAIRQIMQEIPAFYMVFDLIACEGYDLRKATLSERQRILTSLLPESDMIRQVETLQDHGPEFFKLACEQGLEGIVAKDANSSYRSGRNSSWLKIKCTQRENFVIGGFTSPSGGRSHFGSLLVGQYDGENLIYAGRVGTGFDEARLEQIHTELLGHIVPESPFPGIPKEASEATWVSPQVACEVQFNEWTRGGHLRAPSFLRLRPDLEAKDCVQEDDSNEDLQPQSDALEEYPFLSNLNKVFWPDEGFTKEDLVRYYHEIAPTLLPYLKDRPMNLERYPDGYQGKSFYQKDTPDYFPDWIDTAQIESDSSEKKSRYVVCNNRETLVYLANLACIPLHPWSSRVQSLEHPDFVIIDLDPDPKVPFARICQFALHIRQILEQLGLTSYPKTSGSKGLHILVPIEPDYDYSLVRSFAEIVARLAVHNKEEEATIDRSMVKREGRIYIDYLQNGKGKTIVSPYCLRPRPGAPVSTPLEWDEVGSGIRPEAFHIKNVFRRLDRKGDLFKGVLTHKQSLRAALGQLEELMKDSGGPLS